MRKRIFVLFSSFLVIVMVLALPSDLLAARLASPEQPPEPAPAQQDEKQALVDDILSELNQAKGMTDDPEVIDMLNAIIDRVRKLGWLEFTNQEEDALRLKLIIAEYLEKLINELPLASTGATMAVAAMLTSNPLYEELVRVRAKIEKLIELERIPEEVPPPTPTISRLPETERLIVYSAKFLCGPAFGSEGVQRGSYSTAINVHNPHNGRVILYKKAVIANREDEPRGKISGFHRVILGPDEAIEIDCLDIESLLGTQQDLTRLTAPSQEQEGILTTPSLQSSAISPVRSLIRFVKGFVVIYSSAPLDVVAVYTASTPVGFSLDVEYLSPSTAATLPFTPPSEEAKCPRGCYCLTREEALEEGLTAWCGGELKICEYDAQQRPLRYCFEKPTEQVRCPDGCQCLTTAEAREKNLPLCLEETRPCGTDAAGNIMYCYEKMTEVECPQGCECLALTQAEAERKGLTLCADIQCDTDASGKAMYCYREITEVECPQGCECLALTQAEAERKGLTLCADVQCGTDAADQAMYCYRKITEVECPQGCECLALTQAEAERQGLTLCADIQCGTDAAGQAMYCYREITQVECPQGCECLTQVEAKRLGYSLCGGKWIPCGYVPGGPDKWCYQRPD